MYHQMFRDATRVFERQFGTVPMFNSEIRVSVSLGLDLCSPVQLGNSSFRTPPSSKNPIFSHLAPFVASVPPAQVPNRVLVDNELAYTFSALGDPRFCCLWRLIYPHFQTCFSGLMM